MKTQEYLILVDENDHAIGQMEKIEAHEHGLLHRAFSVFIFNEKQELMLQRRAEGKYHSSLLWTNTCCGHPRPGEETLQAAERRLEEEMGFSTTLTKVNTFLYKHDFENQLTEYEYDHIFIGEYHDLPIPNIDEVMDWKFMSLDDLKLDIEANPHSYTYWFKLILEDTSHIENILNNSFA